MNYHHDPILGIGPLGTWEMLIIFVLILLLFGAKRLPGLARSIGKSLGEFRKAKDEFQEEITKGEDEGAKSYEKKRDAPRPRPREIPTEAATVDSTSTDKEQTGKTTDESTSTPA